MTQIRNGPINLGESRLSGWYALYTRHQHEKTVTQILSGRGYEVFLPLYSEIHRWKDRTKQISLPLFPCYVFLHGQVQQRFQILSTPGVYSFVGSGGLPASIPPAEIEAVQRLVETSLRLEPHPFLTCDDRVRVTQGPLAGIQGILIRKKNLCRLVLSVELLQKSVAVEVDASVVERCSPPSVSPFSSRDTSLHVVA
ncbi:MAG: UpxY family transcription antiterminator [Acidobacteria bacterium]|nr:UpxY family transcription antiterminator [Acidobacteriota bacterium]MCI0719231.1 UpxY family transcription antiterminator [Acidobacteriota bacterium]